MFRSNKRPQRNHSTKLDDCSISKNDTTQSTHAYDESDRDLPFYRAGRIKEEIEES